MGGERFAVDLGTVFRNWLPRQEPLFLLFCTGSASWDIGLLGKVFLNWLTRRLRLTPPPPPPSHTSNQDLIGPKMHPVVASARSLPTHPATKSLKSDKFSLVRAPVYFL